MELRRPKKIELAVNLTPLIDCVFLLLIFFLLTSFLMEPEAVEIELPRSAYTEKLKPAEVVILLSREEKIYLGDSLVELNQLARILKERQKTLGLKRVEIRADAQVRLGFLFQVMDEVKNAGIEAVDLQTLPKPKEK